MADKMTDEQRNWYNKQMGSRKVGKDRNGEKKPDETVYKYSSQGDGILRESVLVTGVPYL